MGHIYVLTNTINGKQYVGQTSQKLRYRLNEYRTGRGDRVINRAIKKYGFHNFNVNTIESDADNLDYIESSMIKILCSLVPKGYNIEEGGNKNKIVSNETRKKISTTLKNTWSSDEGKKAFAKISSEERRKKSSEVMTDRWVNDREKMMEVNAKAIKSRDNKKSSDTLKKKWACPIFKAYMIERMKEGHQKKESKERHSAAMKKRHAENPEYTKSIVAIMNAAKEAK